MERKKSLIVVRTILGFLSFGLAILACSLPWVNSENSPQPTITEEPASQASFVQNTEEQETVTEVPQAVEASPPEPGSTLRWIDSSLLVYIPPGEFIMGQDGEDNPEHAVFLDGFWIYRTEVTNRMYLNCMAMGKCSPPAIDPAIPDLEDPDLADFPVVGVRWYQGLDYCEFVDGTLPTEAQWEKAARGTDGRPFPWGNAETNCELLNFNECLGKTSPVNIYPAGASPFDVLDMAGNVFEWVADWYQEDYYSDAPFDNPMGPEFGEVRSVRGSTYRSAPNQVESALRYFLGPDEYRTDLGFRCVVGKAQEYAPPCTVLAKAPEDDLGKNPDEAPGGSASCVVPEPELSVVTYCEKGQRGNNISWTPVDAEVNYSILESAWCSQYDEDTLACVGNYGATVSIEACKSCPAPVVQLGIVGACDPPYVFDETTRLCKYAGPPVPGAVNCAPGYSLSGDDSCCDRVDRTPLDFPVCPVGGVYEPSSKICWFTLPSTGDEKCVNQSVFFRWCPAEREPRPSDPCLQYSFEECRLHLNDGCHWDYKEEVCRGS